MKASNSNNFAGNMLKENKDVANLRAMLSGNGMEDSDLEDLMEELE